MSTDVSMSAVLVLKEGSFTKRLRVYAFSFSDCEHCRATHAEKGHALKTTGCSDPASFGGSEDGSEDRDDATGRYLDRNLR